MLGRAAAALLTLALAAGCASAPRRAVDLTELGVADAAALIRSKKVSSVELTEAYLARAEANLDLNAFITLDRAGALAAARRADAALAVGVPPKGVLYGVPLVVKDNTHVAGLPNTAGTPGLREFVPTEHAPTVTALVNAGAVILGKTNMHELAFGISGYNEAFCAARHAGRDAHRAAGVAAEPPGCQPRGDGGAGAAAAAARDARAVVRVARADRLRGDGARPALLTHFVATFEKYAVEALIGPTTPSVAVPQGPEASSFETFVRFIRNTDPGSNAGMPGLTIPAGLGPTTRLPVGISLDGLPDSDERLLAVGLVIEQVLGRTPPPRR